MVSVIITTQPIFIVLLPATGLPFCVEKYKYKPPPTATTMTAPAIPENFPYLSSFQLLSGVYCLFDFNYYNKNIE